MLLVFSLYSSDDKYDNEFLENYAKINLVPEVQRVPGVGTPWCSVQTILCVSG